MGPRIALLSFVVCVLVPREARADELGTARYTYGEPCADDTDLVGYRRCSPYGAWSYEPDEPYVFIDYGLTWRQFRVSRPAIAARATAPRDEDARTSSLLFAERIGIALARGAHVTLELEIGNSDFQRDEHGRDIILGGLGAIGFLGSVAPLALGVELAGGYHGYTDPSHRELTGEGVVEIRGRGHVWVTPWFTIGAVAGASLLRRGDWMTGLNLGFHSRAFGG